jgi:alkylmercury lyase-like protein
VNLLVRVRVAVLERTIASGQVPTAGEIAAELDLPVAMVQEAYAKLGEAHVFVCEPGDPSRLRMANPFSAVPTSFRVSARGGSYYGNCAWDSLGVVSLLGGEGRVETSCPDCSEPLRLSVSDGKLVESTGVVHFGVPARHWWDDIVFT